MTEHQSSSSARDEEFARVDVAIVNYNGAEHLVPCLDGLVRQGARLGDLWIVDNASTDGSLELARRRAPSARVVELPTNGGPCPARNRGLREARTAWVLLLDNDAVLEDGVLEKLVRVAREHTNAAIVQPRSVFASEPSRVHYDGGALHYVGLFSLRNFYAPIASAEGRGALEVGGAVSVAMLVKRELALASGGFDEGFFILFEDLDLSLRLRARGHSIWVVEDALCLHRGGTPGISHRGGDRYPSSRAFFHSRNRWLHLLKNYSWRTLLVASPALVVYEFVWAVFCVASGTFGGYLRGKFGFLKLAGAALRERRAIQQARKLPDRELLIGGPLTIAPHVTMGGARGFALGLLDGFLRVWWKLVRPLAG